MSPRARFLEIAPGSNSSAGGRSVRCKLQAHRMLTSWVQPSRTGNPSSSLAGTEPALVPVGKFLPTTFSTETLNSRSMSPWIEATRVRPMARAPRSSPRAAPSFTRRPSSPLLASDPVWLTVSQLCARWQLSRKTVYKFIAASALPVWKVGRHMYRVAVADVLRFEIRNRLAATGPASTSRRRRRNV